MKSSQIIIYLIIAAYFSHSLWVTIKIIRNNFLSSGQKIFNSILTWLIPFVWGIIVVGMIKPVDTTVKKGVKNSGSNTDNWQNLTGGNGGAY